MSQTLSACESGRSQGSLWDWTLRFTQGDELKALQWLATLFSDIDKLTHVYAVMSLQKDATDFPKTELLKKTNECLKTQVGFDLLPRFAKIKVSRALYHFYVVGYATRKTAASLTQAGMRNPGEMASKVGFIFNTSYEYFRHRLIPGLDRIPNPKDSSEMVKLRWLDIPMTIAAFIWPQDPRRVVDSPVPTNPAEYTDGHLEYLDVIDDVYMGYAGAFFGGVRKALPCEDIQGAWAQNPYRFMSEMMSK